MIDFEYTKRDPAYDPAYEAWLDLQARHGDCDFGSCERCLLCGFPNGAHDVTCASVHLVSTRNVTPFFRQEPHAALPPGQPPGPDADLRPGVRSRHDLMGDRDIAERLTALLRERGLITVQPRYRYFETPDRWMFIWTVERITDDDDRERYASAVYVPKGRGARSGDPSRWVVRREVHHSTRRAAKARALRMYRQHADELRGR